MSSGSFVLLVRGGFSDAGCGHFGRLNPGGIIAVRLGCAPLWERTILIIPERWGASSKYFRRAFAGQERVSEWQVGFSIVGLATLAELGGTPGSFHGQDQNQEGLVEMAVMKLRRLSEDIGHDVVSEVEFLEDGRFEFHKQRSRVDFVRRGTGSEQAEFVFEVAQLGQGVLTAALLLGRRATWGEGGRRWRARRLGTETKAADVEVFLKAVRLEEIGEFEGSDVAALGADLALKVDDDGAHILE